MGLKQFFAGSPARESAVMHDCFHPLTSVEKSNAAREVRAQAFLTGLQFDNLRKRIPVKASDSAVAINYETLYRKARGYHFDPEDLPPTFAPPPNVALARKAYEDARTAEELRVAVDKLRTISK